MSGLRLAGLTVPLFSLRSERGGGIGEIDDLVPLVEWAAANGQRVIALLPLGELAQGEASPYSALSSFAIDPLYVTPATIEELDGVAITPPPVSSDAVDRDRTRAWKQPLFDEAVRRFRSLASGNDRRVRFENFRQRASWLEDYALFRALLEEQAGCSWKDWSEPLRRRKPRALTEARRRHAERIFAFEYLQFVADDAWRRVRRAAARHGVLLMGDLPFAPSENSADVWANPSIFDPSRSVGAPPDAFSATGQRWGLPMYRWATMRRRGWRWLRARVRRMAELYDLFRVDHVVGLFRTFSFVGESPNGFHPPQESAQIAQGREILQMMIDEGRPAQPVAEDLGVIPAFVTETLAALDIPGYKVLRWVREGDRFVDPASYPECSIATTGTHDTDSLVAWWGELPPPERRALLDLLSARETAGAEFSRELRYAILGRLYASPSRMVIVPVQDLFGWPQRINTPATTGGDNWTFRLPVAVERMSAEPHIAAESTALRALIDASGRLRKIDGSSPCEPLARGNAGEARDLEVAMDQFKSGSVSANGLRFHYLEAGTGPLVLCLHGFPDHARSFRFQLPALAKAGFRAVAPYLRGYAPTDVPANGPYQAAALARDAAALLDALSPGEPAYVFGHDWGAIAAYGAAILAPSRIRKLVTAAVPHGPQLMQAIVTSYAQMRRSWYIFMFQMPTADVAVSQNGFEFLDRLWADWSPGWTLPAEEMASLKATFQKPGVLAAALGYYRHTFNPAFQVAALAALQAKLMTDPIHVPTLVFHGQRDGCIGVETLDGMEDVCPKGLEKVVLVDAGHFVHQEKPLAVNEALIAFLKS